MLNEPPTHFMTKYSSLRVGSLFTKMKGNRVYKKLGRSEYGFISSTDVDDLKDLDDLVSKKYKEDGDPYVLEILT